MTTAFLKNILTPQIEFEGIDDADKFLKIFCDLYRIELFKDGLDLILTNLKQKHIKFEVRVMKGWDTNLGCFLTEQSSYYDDKAGKFIRTHQPKIILRNLSYNLLAHEMAHALEFESGLNFGEDFRTAIGFDMKNRDPQSQTLKGAIKHTMVDPLKLYKPGQFLSELFARYFELLSLSRNVCARGDFATSDVMDFFANTTKFLAQIFNPKIKAKVDAEIARVTDEIAKQVRLEGPQHKFQEHVESVQRKTGGSWAKTARSNSMWLSGWQKTQALEEDKKNKK
jgi:hypothetical protein